MKKILITGVNSYIGVNVGRYLSSFGNLYTVDELDVKGEGWKTFNFSSYDAVFHVAGIAHVKETKENAHLYYEINCDLAVKIAQKAKEEGVSHFVFMSSMSVYGLESSKDLINSNTPTLPKTNYGKGKLKAEKLLSELSSDNFAVTLVRPPMVYGDGCPGNLTKLFNVVRKFHIFPTIKNQRSSITVEKLSYEIKKIIDNGIEGVCLPQNDEYLCTSEIVKQQMDKENVKVLYTSLFNPIIKFLIGKIGLITKAFGDLKYERAE